MALALYRRYRPDTFDGVVGQDQVTVPLSRALDAGKLTHAYLFSGPRGCGKTSSARILARCVNCAQGPTSHPCGVCESCKDLATGGSGSIDVVEIDAASHNGVDDARELRERAGFAPARDRYKIFILDEAHMVTQQGFNALLKIVEEPPEHVMFIFATTEPDKVIGTIRSRTHHYPFRLVPTEVMGPYLESVCAQEGITAEPGVLALAMRAGGGSVRDTLSVLDQLMVGAVNGVIGHEAAVALLGYTPGTLIGQAIDAVVERDGEKLYGVVQKVVVGGFDPRRFVEDLLARVRDLLVLALAGRAAERVLGGDGAQDMDALRRQVSMLGLSALTGMADVMNDTLAAMTGAISPRMRLELLAARLLAGMETGFAASPGRRGDGAAGDADSTTATSSDVPANGNGMMGAQRTGFAGAPRFHGQSRRSASVVVPDGTDADSVRHGAQPSVGTFPGTAPTTGGDDGTATFGFARGQVAQIAGNASGSDDSHAIDPSRSADRPTQGGGSPHAQMASGGESPTQGTPPMDPQIQGAASHQDVRSVDERWDAVVAALPDDVREYVTRAKVPSVALSANASGKVRLAMTFDCALSQHAFALAVSSDGPDSGRKAAQVVLAAVRGVFGEGTSIAPTAVAADGNRVESTKRMTPERLAQVKRQIALAKAGIAQDGLAAAAHPHPAQAKEAKTAAAPRRNDGKDDGAEDDPGHRKDRMDPPHRRASGGATSGTTQSDGEEGNPGPPVAADEDGDGFAGMSVQLAPSSPSVTESDIRHDEGEDDDPWLHPVRIPADDAVGHDGERGHDREPDGRVRDPEHRTKHVVVPNVDDGIDPWAVTPSPPQSAGSMPEDVDVATGAPESAVDSVGQDGTLAAPAVWGTRRQKPNAGSQSGRDSGAHADDDPWIRPPSLPHSEESQPSSSADAREGEPEDADEDEYSLDDRSLTEGAAIGFEELDAMFDVKRVEELEPDDPHNPRNTQAHHKRQEG